jgi:hypothetical protein
VEWLQQLEGSMQGLRSRCLAKSPVEVLRLGVVEPVVAAAAVASASAVRIALLATSHLCLLLEDEKVGER